MELADIAEGLARQTLEQVLAPGTIKIATAEEETIGRCLLPVVTLDQLENQLSQNPETSIVLESARPIAIILQAATRSGTRGRCKILVVRPLLTNFGEKAQKPL